MVPERREWKRKAAARIFALFCAVVLCSTLAAGLWPFHAPLNKATWRVGNRGLHFGRSGTALSLGTFKPLTPAAGQPGRSLELWITPSTVWDKTTTVLAFYTPQQGEHFSLHQAYDGLILESDDLGEAGPNRRTRIPVPKVLHREKSLFVTVVEGPQRTTVWIDGSPAASASQFPLGMTGSMIMANSPIKDDSWHGDLRGLAIFDSALSQEQIVSHYQTWTAAGRPHITEDDRAMALYLCDEGQGNVLHNKFDPTLNLQIPRRYMVLNEKFLEPFWQEFSWDISYWRSALINVAGLMPLGFFFSAYFAWVQPLKRPVLTTVALGLAVSLTIEVLQSFLPTRDSGTTDLVTNTLGSYLGTLLFGKSRAGDLLALVLGREPVASQS